MFICFFFCQIFHSDSILMQGVFINPAFIEPFGLTLIEVLISTYEEFIFLRLIVIQNQYNFCCSFVTGGSLWFAYGCHQKWRSCRYTSGKPTHWLYWSEACKVIMLDKME
jgi:hypothetical protein